jgi:hypothetical protein
MRGLNEATRDFVALLERSGFPYAIMGGMAVRIHALPRPTFDVDFAAAIPREALPELYNAAEKIGFAVPAPQAAGWIDTVRGLPVIKFQWFIGNETIDVDVFLAEPAFLQEVLRRRQRHMVEELDAWFVSPEDLVLLKLLSNRPKDRTDIADIVFIQGRLDEQYLNSWSVPLGIDELVREVLVERPPEADGGG